MAKTVHIGKYKKLNCIYRNYNELVLKSHSIVVSITFENEVNTYIWDYINGIFDGTMLVFNDDPHLDIYEMMDNASLCDIRYLPIDGPHQLQNFIDNDLKKLHNVTNVEVTITE